MVLTIQIRSQLFGSMSYRSCIRINTRLDAFYLVKTVPVNYGIRLSGPRDLPHRLPWLVWRRRRPIASPSVCCIKTRSPLAAFPTTLSFPFFPLHSPHTTPVVSQASASSTFPRRPPLPTERYDAACETNASARPPALIRSTPP